MPLQHPLVKATRPVVRQIFTEALEGRLLFDGNTPTVNTVTPANGATAIALNVTVQATVNLPNGGVDPSTVTSNNVFLYQTAFPNNNSKYVPSSVKTTGGRDALILSPLQNLLPSTSYTFVVSAGVKDINGDAFTPYSESFTTGNSVPGVDQNFAFSQTALPTTQGLAFTDLQIGPDGLFYGSTEDGRIIRYGINADGTLQTPQIITSLQTANGGANRLISGFAFDPSFIADPTKPKIWVSNTYYALSGAANAPNFTSKLTVMSGPNLQTVTDALINLPRSVADHVNDQPVFQPGTHNLFFCQAGQNAYGAPDSTWGNRAETLLSAAILEVNTDLLNLSGPPLNVLTSDVGGSYNPYAANAPVTLYATGIRNAFDLLFDDQGQLWAPANGSSSGGNSPGNGSTVPALTDIQQVEEDQLFKVQKGSYYGHPNPVRGQYVLDQGNPTSGAIPGLAFTAYPSGTSFDKNYHTPNYVFGLHASPDGIIEYHGSAFGGKLDGKFLISEYSAPNDILVLTRNSTDNIISSSAERAVSGFTHLNGPLSLVEDQATGYIYVSELGGNKITLLKPANVKQQLLVSRSTVVPFNTIATGNAGASASRTAMVTLTNNGADQLTLGSVSIINNPFDAPGASNFTILNASSIPTSLNTLGASFTLQIQYTATAVGLQSALLQIKSNDPTSPTLDLDLRGIGTAGQFGTLVPSLVQVLRAHDIPTIVGAGPNDANGDVVNYPTNPDPSSEEVALQKLTKAGPGVVSITPLASFSSASQPVSTIGYYTSGNPSTATALFSINQADDQIVDPTPVGTTTFDPGSNLFGIYGFFPGVTTSTGAGDYHYSEDALNNLDPTTSRKIRFFPYKNNAGAVVPNSYVFAIEDSNNPSVNSFTSFVGIISNVAGIPNVPTNVTASTAGNNGVVLNWTASAGATSYVVQRQDPGSAGYTVVATGLASPTYTDANVSAGATYSYQVEAQNAVGVSAFSTPVSATEPQVAPAAPTNLTVTSASASGVTLTWNASAAATSYTLFRLSPGASTFAQIATGLTATTYTDLSILPNQRYQYEVTASNASGASPNSTALSETVPAASQSASVTIGRGANKAVQFATDASAVVLIKFSGAGTATVNFSAATISQAMGKTGVVVSGTGLSVASILTTGSGANSVLTITTRGGNKSVSVGNIAVDGSIGAIVAGSTALVGTLQIAGAANRIALGSASAATLTTGGGIGTLSVPLVSGLMLTAGGAVRNITATTWTSTQPISAPSIGTFTVKGAAQFTISAAVLHALHVKGALSNSSIVLSGSGVLDLAQLSAGSISNTTIDTTGSIGAVSTASLMTSQIYAGAGASGVVAFPPASGSFTDAASIGSVTVRKVRGAVSTVDSDIAAFKINALNLGVVQFANQGVAFGAEATSINAVHATDSSTGQAFVLNRLLSAADVAAQLAAKGVTAQDFTIDII